jgi:drug/metabolite transporter (DMT)-like permease
LEMRFYVAPSGAIRIHSCLCYKDLALIRATVLALTNYRTRLRSIRLNLGRQPIYLVPVVTAGLDYVCLGNKLSLLCLVGMGAILIGLWLVFKTKVLKSTGK